MYWIRLRCVWWTVGLSTTTHTNKYLFSIFWFNISEIHPQPHIWWFQKRMCTFNALDDSKRFKKYQIFFEFFFIKFFYFFFFFKLVKKKKKKKKISQSCQSLKHLNWEDTKITDEGMKYLPQSLKHLDIDHRWRNEIPSSVTQTGYEGMKYLPHSNILTYRIQNHRWRNEIPSNHSNIFTYGILRSQMKEWNTFPWRH